MKLKHKIILATIWQFVKLLPIDRYILYILLYFKKKSFLTKNKVDDALLESLLITYDVWQVEKKQRYSTRDNNKKYDNMIKEFREKYK